MSDSFKSKLNKELKHYPVKFNPEYLQSEKLYTPITRKALENNSKNAPIQS